MIDINLKGKKAVVTGASSGIGKAVALALFVKQLKAGIAIALKTERTETTTTSSIKENPFSFSNSKETIN